MFSSKPKTSSSPSRVSIEEANSHLQLVHQRVEQLENIIDKQTNQLITNEDNYKKELKLLNTCYEKQVNELNSEIDLLKNKVKDLESKVIQQNLIINENNKEIEKFNQIIKFTPNLDKLLKLLNSLAINKNNNTIKTDQMNGFSDKNRNFDHKYEKNSKKSVKYKLKSDENSVNNCNAGEEVVSASSSSTSGQSPGNNSLTSIQTTTSSTGILRKSSNSKLNIARSFNITSNFSDEEECDQRSGSRKISIIH